MIDPIGQVTLLEPLTFDGGVLRRSLRVAGGAAGNGGALSVSGESTFFRELSVRVDYDRDFWYQTNDGHRIGWRLRLPVIQSHRFGRLDAWQFNYRQEAHIGPVDPLAPAHVFDSAFLWARGARGWPSTAHLQLGPVVRDRAQAGPEGARAGSTVRVAHAVLLGRPHADGRWSVSLNTVEAVWLHYGLVGKMDARLDVSALAPSVHLGRGTRGASVSLLPRMRFAYSPAGVDIDWGGYAVLQSNQVPRLE